MTACQCTADEPVFDTEVVRFVGIDETNGRFARVAVERCRRCGRLWLRYAVEYEGFSESGRWYRGQIGADLARTVAAETALGVLAGLAWHVYGGSYFRTAGRRGTGPLFVDL
jgi:hypothetical protein